MMSPKSIQGRTCARSGQAGGRCKDLVVNNAGSSLVHESKRLQAPKPIFTSPLSQSDHIVLDREKATGQSIGTPRSLSSSFSHWR
jgi:hypothetical protein